MLLSLIVDFLFLLGGLGGLILGLRRGFLRTILSTIALLLAMAFAALAATPLVSIFVRESGSRGDTPIGIVFSALVLGIYFLLERLLRSTFPDTRIPALGSLDNVLGFVVAVGWTLLVLALIALLLGFVNGAVTGSPAAGFIGSWYTTSFLVPFLQDLILIPINLMRFLFPGGLPQPLAFFAGS
jgi:hypothetical protein